MKHKKLWLSGSVFFVMMLLTGGCFWFYHYITTPVISVIMPTYNRQELLPQAINSILDQTYGKFELIIINDGSTDDTARLLKEYQDYDKRIKVITNQKNEGIVASLNKGLEIARGQYIARMDDDDVSLPQRFELQKKYLESHLDVTVVGSSRRILPRYQLYVYQLEIERPSDLTALMSYYQVPLFHPSAMIRADFLRKNQIHYRKKYNSSEDTDFWHQIVLAGGKIEQLTPTLVIRGLTGNKKKSYFMEQKQSYANFLNDSLKEIRGDYIFENRWLEDIERCFILQNIHKTELYNKSFDDKTIQYQQKFTKCDPNLSYQKDPNANQIIALPKQE